MTTASLTTLFAEGPVATVSALLRRGPWCVTLAFTVACEPYGEGYCFSDEWDSAEEGVVFIKQGVANPRESLHCWCPDPGKRDPADVECSPVGVSCFQVVYEFDYPESGSQLIRSKYSENVYKLTPANLEEIRAACTADTGDTSGQ